MTGGFFATPLYQVLMLAEAVLEAGSDVFLVHKRRYDTQAFDAMQYKTSTVPTLPSHEHQAFSKTWLCELVGLLD